MPCVYLIQAGEGPSTSTVSWTSIGAPPSPRTPRVISITGTTIKLRLFPVTSNVGPVSSYQLYLRDRYVNINYHTPNRDHQQVPSTRVFLCILLS